MVVRTLCTHVALACCLFLGNMRLDARTSYYVDPKGNDNNDGRSPAAAWRTLDKINSTTFSSGDSILLRRGAVWFETLSPSASGTAGSPIVFASYDNGKKPVIDAGSSLPGWSAASNWTSRGNNIWTISCGRFPGRLWLSGREYGRSGTTDWANRHGSSTPTAQFRWYWESGTLSVYASSNPASAYSSMETADGGSQAVEFSGKSWLTFANLEFRRGSTCITFSASTHITFDSCKAIGGTASYGLRATRASDYGTVMNNCIFDREDTVHYTFDGPLSGQDGSSGGGDDAISLNCSSHWDIRDSYFGATRHSGVNMDDGDNVANAQYNMIHDCEFVGGTDYDRAFLMNAIYSKYGASYNEFYRNYVHGMETVSQMGGYMNRVYYNVWADQGHIPWETDINSWRSDVLQSTDDHYQDSCFILNNTFYGADRVQVSIPGGSRHVIVENNILHNGGRDNNPNCPYIAVCLWAGAQTNTVRNNVIYSPYSTTTCIVNQDQYMGGFGTPRTVTYMQSNPGQNAITGNITSDPKIQPDFRIASASPARDAGLSVGLSCVDFFGTPVPSAKPDIGACEVPTTPVAGAEEVRPPSGLATFQLEQNYPNPFNPATSIQYALPRESRVTLQVFDILGRCVATLVEGTQPAGVHQVRFDGRTMASGTYVYRLQADGQLTLVRKMQIVR